MFKLAFYTQRALQMKWHRLTSCSLIRQLWWLSSCIIWAAWIQVGESNSSDWQLHLNPSFMYIYFSGVTQSSQRNNWLSVFSTIRLQIDHDINIDKRGIVYSNITQESLLNSPLTHFNEVSDDREKYNIRIIILKCTYSMYCSTMVTKWFAYMLIHMLWIESWLTDREGTYCSLAIEKSYNIIKSCGWPICFHTTSTRVHLETTRPRPLRVWVPALTPAHMNCTKTANMPEFSRAEPNGLGVTAP